MEVEVKIAQSCLTLCYPMDYTVHAILPARILEWIAFPLSRGSSQPGESDSGLPHYGRILYQLNYKGSLVVPLKRRDLFRRPPLLSYLLHRAQLLALTRLHGPLVQVSTFTCKFVLCLQLKFV